MFLTFCPLAGCVEWIAKRLKARATTTRTLADSHSINNRGGATRDQKRKGGRFWRGDGLRHRPKLISPTLSRPEKGQARSKNARAGASCFAPFVGAKSEDLFAPAPLRFVLVPGLLLWLLATPKHRASRELPRTCSLRQGRPQRVKGDSAFLLVSANSKRNDWAVRVGYAQVALELGLPEAFEEAGGLVALDL